MGQKCSSPPEEEPQVEVAAPSSPAAPRTLSLPQAVRAAGGIDAWNSQSTELSQLLEMFEKMCTAGTVDKALEEVAAVMNLGHNLWAYAYLRVLYSRDLELFYGALLERPSMLLPVVYAPTVGEACQRFGAMPFHRRGCYVSITDRGNVRAVLEEYAQAEGMERGPDGRYLCDCMVFSDGGRILGLGDLGAWGMGIPVGKLDLYTVCAGVDPRRTVPVLLDAGCAGADGNTDGLAIRDHQLYTGLRQDRAMQASPAGTKVNACYYGEGSMIAELFKAAGETFGPYCLLQFEGFSSSDAFPLLAEYREKHATCNGDIQGAAAAAVAAIMGAIRLRDPKCTDLLGELRKQSFLFHGAGSANLGTLRLLADEAGVPKAKLHVTNSRGVIWKSKDGKAGSFKNEEQKEFARVGKCSYKRGLAPAIAGIKPNCLIGAVGRDPGCFDQKVMEAMVKVNGSGRPVVFALSNPRTQAEVAAKDAYAWSNGKAIYGSGTAFEPVEVEGRLRRPGQVNDVYIFPGVSFAAVCCQAQKIPERFFLVAAEAVANSLDENDLEEDRVVPNPERIREVSLNVATAVVLEAQRQSLAGVELGSDEMKVRERLRFMMWAPERE